MTSQAIFAYINLQGPEDVCLRVSGTQVCGTTEVSQGCDLTLRRDGTGGAVTVCYLTHKTPRLTDTNFAVYLLPNIVL